jgi:hypothetical protein
MKVLDCCASTAPPVCSAVLLRMLAEVMLIEDRPEDIAPPIAAEFDSKTQSLEKSKAS